MQEDRVEVVTASWKEQPKKLAQKLVQQYGQPDEVTRERLVWHNHGPWKRTELLNEEFPHNFPEPHRDSLLQAIPYRVPVESVSKVLEFDGSVVVERTRGELAARCDDERANYLALNLAHEVITGKKSVDDARRFYAETVQLKKHQEYMERFLFSVPAAGQADPDVPVKAQ
jgi:hypothetical protein